MAMPCSVEVTRSADEPSHVLAAINGRRVEADAVKISPGVYSILLDGRSIEVRAETLADSLLLHALATNIAWKLWTPARGDAAAAEESISRAANRFRRRWPEKLCASWLRRGQQVETSQGLLVVEAMKMQNEIRSPKTGTVERLSPRKARL